MQKDPQQQQQWGELQLNQSGRPKQKVLFYQLTQQMKEQAQQQLSKDLTIVSEQDYLKMTSCGGKVWDKFYQFHKCNFFKDRTYLQRQMPEVTYFKQRHQQLGLTSNYYQLGCGVGNTLFPLLRQFHCFNYYGCDISAKAIILIEQEMDKHPDLKPKMHVCVCDLVKDQIPYQLVGDLNSMIFVLSAIAPEKHAEVMLKVGEAMKPGSFLFFRDYGRYDFGQLNLSSKGNRKLRDNFYRKNDGVCVYYFEEEELEGLCAKAGLKKIKINLHCKLLQNRKTGLKMYRVWIQGRFYKPSLEAYFEEKLSKQLEKEAIEEETEKKQFQKQYPQQKQQVKEEKQEQNVYVENQAVHKKEQQKQEQKLDVQKETVHKKEEQPHNKQQPIL